jgi:glyoxylase-like metal-dependent hydrolase (beta-lactamase superfamily II)
MTKVHALSTGRVQVRNAQRESRGGSQAARVGHMLFDPDWSEWLPVHVWLIEHDEGFILVDTGETSRVHERGYHPRWNPFFRRAVHFSVHPEEELGPQLRALGIGPRDVKTVVLTHLHTDHAGGLFHVTGSRSLVAPGEFKTATGAAGRLMGYLSHRWPKWWQPEFIRFDRRQVGPFDEAMPVTKRGDVLIVPTPGHTPHHVSVLVQGEPSFFLAGDTSYNQELLLAGRVDGVSPNQRVALETHGRILGLARERPLVYLPSHDSKSGARLAGLLTL